jgi:hypothetical protein
MKQVAVRIRNHYSYYYGKVNNNAIKYRLPIELPPMFDDVYSSTPFTINNIYINGH